MSASVTVGPRTVSTTNDITASGYAFAAQDEAAGITIYGTGPTTVYVTNLLNQGVKPGDRIVLQGSNAWFRGLYESMRVVISNVFVATNAPTFAAANYLLTNTAGQVATLRMQDAADPLVGTPIPSLPCVIGGIMAHDSTNSPGINYTDGRQVMPLALLPIPEPARLAGVRLAAALLARRR